MLDKEGELGEELSAQNKIGRFLYFVNSLYKYKWTYNALYSPSGLLDEVRDSLTIAWDTLCPRSRDAGQGRGARRGTQCPE